MFSNQWRVAGQCMSSLNWGVQFCNITLVTKEGKELNAHRNVLSAASPFFCKLLQSDMKENKEGIVRFELWKMFFNYSTLEL